MTMPWQPNTPEDQLLDAYWQSTGGRLFLEVPIGRLGGRANWPEGTRIRRIDAVRVVGPTAPPIRYTRDGQFEAAIRGQALELLEAKTRLGRYLLGQVIIGLDMFELDYEGFSSLIGVAVVRDTDPGLIRLCDRRAIRVETMSPDLNA